ncbi:hypothetical protein BLA29_009915 [Euroglyphus maynei]|uniref:Uncharacterized protein n=1 Tax=Euroglyphus maynei TaxID=6958 RepID=A0A1Y3AQU3_EURMA|nr:hypothetical protein BLA29_009915 [Euroglyphus maynei]
MTVDENSGPATDDDDDVEDVPVNKAVVLDKRDFVGDIKIIEVGAFLIELVEKLLKAENVRAVLDKIGFDDVAIEPPTFEPVD